jgi:YkoY family integral membrane protein
MFLDYAATVLTLVVLEGLLSADNALVLALLVRHLPEAERGRALRIGLIGAFAFRAVGVALAVWLIQVWYVKAIGAAWLLFLSVRHFIFPDRKTAGGESAPRSFWKTVLWVELTDVVFSVDSILAAVAISTTINEEVRIYIIYLGGILGIVAMRFVAGLFLKLLDRFPGLETAAYLMIAWIGIKLGVEVYVSQQAGESPGIPRWMFWTVLGALLLGGVLFSRRKNGPPEPDRAALQ